VDPERDDVRTLRLNTILRYIDTQICDPALTPQHLCSEFGLSRAALYRMFEPIGGVADHIRNRKLDVAYARILNLPGRNENIGTVAGALGFYDHAHLSHRFKERFGITPKGLVQLEGNARRPKTTRTKKASAAGRQPLLFDLITQSYA
jgi:AraC-like DNA-binding protein